MINGINLNDMVQNQVTFQPTINTVSEFKVDNSTYSAEFGRNSGAIVNIATRSGSNEYHGELYEYLRNNYFDARNAFNRVTDSSGNPVAQSPFKRNQFGGDFGGPIVKGKTYFFLSYEGLRHRQGLNTSTGVLTDAQRTAAQAAGNPVVNSLLGLIPRANSTSGTSAVPNAFLGSATAPVNIDQGTADISHNISERDRIHGYYVYQNDFRLEPTQGANIPGFGDTRAGHRQVLTINESHVFSPTMVNEFRAGANRILITFTPNNLTSPASLGLASILGPNETFMPTIAISDAGVTFGDERNFPQGRGDTTFALGDTLSYIRGKHSFKFGGEFRDFRNDNFNGDPGQIIFNSTAHFIAGAADSAARTIGNVANRINVNALDFFAQDSWKFTQSLTFELGLRYAWNMTPSEAKDRFVTLVPGAGTASQLVPTSQPYAQNNKNFQPRVGFAWNLRGNTVVRGGYAYQVDQPISGVVTGLSSNPPFALPIAVAGTATTPIPLANLTPSFNGTPTTVSPSLVNPDFKNADVQSWNLNIEQQVGKSLGLMVGYFGSKGTHLEIDRNINRFATLGTAGTRPFTALSASSPILHGVGLGNSLSERDSSGTSTYNALYTWSHSIDTNSRNNQGVIAQDSNNIFGSVGNSDFDARHRFVANAIYDLPFKGNRLVSGWELAPIVSFQSGNPFNIVFASSGVTGSGNTIRPNVSGPVQVTGNPSQWIGNLTVFSNPGNNFGNLGRNSVVGPGFGDVDLALIKNTKINERYTFQIRMDAFDLLNHPNYGQPNNVIALPFTSTSTFGQILSTRFPTGDSGSSRQLQVAAKVTF